MEPFVQPMEFTGKYPDGWPGYTWLDYDKASNAFHPGDDYNWGSGGNSDLGKAVLSTYKGICVYSGDDSIGYGKMIVLKHDLDANLQKYIKDNYGITTKVLFSLYAHLLERNVAVGNSVHSGALIGRCGTSGNSVYAHLHFEIFAPIGELAGKPWRFYPIAWTKEKIKQYWIPPYPFIEAYRSFVSQNSNTGDKDALIRSLQEQVSKLQTELVRKLAEKDNECKLKLESYKNKVVEVVKNTTY